MGTHEQCDVWGSGGVKNRQVLGGMLFICEEVLICLFKIWSMAFPLALVRLDISNKKREVIFTPQRELVRCHGED